MSKPKAPKPPDPYETANADFAYNNMNQRTPYGNVDITAPIFDQNNHVVQPGTVTMTPTDELRRQLGLQNELTEGALGLARGRQQALEGQLPPMASGIDFSQVRNTPQFNAPQLQGINVPNLPQLRSLDNDFSGERQRVEQAQFARARGLLDPMFAEQERGIRSTLADQGLPAESEARNNELGQFYGQRNQAYNQAAQDAVMGGGQEQSRMFDMANNARMADFGAGMNRANAQFGMNQDARLSNFDAALRGQGASFDAGMRGRQMDITDQLQNFNLIGQNRATLFNELQALLGQQQVAQPTLQNFYAPQGSSFLGAQQLTSNMQSQNYSTGAQMFGDMMGAASSLAGGAMMSDKRMKEDIKKVGKTEGGHNIYSYRYKGSPLIQLGVMAQELEKKKPDAVKEVAGIKFVDYSKVH